ncbi:hypothetical protein CGX12_01615 [Zobellella denitrificans]|uniref:Uncharacterized protein n=1 Tax=Zobellella denitrificans TaxID=347534 RepID=A0A231N3J1_9GAMM|nr:DUF1538 domain-containing protein [Zobellella denitrificans]ATG74101.1 hypothetical protein AN401_09760 [Zobellella denitrificans]OXS16948.1 hypothetical protein CGX12_01615 [Zobellella denitrificans]
MHTLRLFAGAFLHALNNLLPIIGVVLLFQLLLGQWPEDAAGMALGLLIVAAGIALFLQGLELSIFPLGKSLANQFARKGSVPILLCFGFAMGFSAVIAEPALIAVASQAELVSQGRIQALTLRLIVALSVGLVMAAGVLRIILGQGLHWYMIGGYSLVVLVTFFAPPEIVGLAYDSGGVTTNIVTVPLIAAMGIGLAASIKGRNPLMDGFGLVALAVMVPMVSVQLYGIVTYSLGAAPLPVPANDIQDTVIHSPWLRVVFDLVLMLRDVTPILVVVLFFQYLVLKRSLSNPTRVFFGFLMVLVGLYAFVVGLKLGLFPIGTRMAEQLIGQDRVLYIYLFAFAIGFATTMAEPALIAVGHQAEQAAPGELSARAIRLVVALGVALGITLGVHRIISGGSIHHFIIGSYLLVLLLIWICPRNILALAFDLGGVTTSEVTVPLITALGIGLASHIEGRNVLIDGFGLIAFASIYPIVTVMIYAIAADLLFKYRRASS